MDADTAFEVPVAAASLGQVRSLFAGLVLFVFVP